MEVVVGVICGGAECTQTFARVVYVLVFGLAMRGQHDRMRTAR